MVGFKPGPSPVMAFCPMGKLQLSSWTCPHLAQKTISLAYQFSNTGVSKMWSADYGISPLKHHRARATFDRLEGIFLRIR